jgi:hypothetical protein
MSKYYCKCCGKDYPSVSNLVVGSCSKNPEGKHHSLYEGSEKSQYICKFCGSKYPTIANLCVGSCQKSPTKHHSPAL